MAASQSWEACMSSTTELSQLNYHKNLAQWQQLVYDCHNSGMTVRAWCAENGISKKTYYYRQRKVWEATQQQKAEQDADMPGKLLSIIPCAIPVVTTVSAQTPALILRSTSWTVEVNPGCDPELLHLVLRTVK
jgi:putative transposase